MRTIKNVFAAVILSVALFSCSNEDITLKGTISGTVSNYSATNFDALTYYDGDANLGSCTPEKSGKFSMTLTTPELVNITEGFGVGMNISDQNTQAGGLSSAIAASKSSSYTGIVVKTDANISPEDYQSFAGIYAMFLYADRSCTIKGTTSYSDSGMTYSESDNLSLKKGWNEIAVKVQISSTTSTVTVTASSKLPTNLKWKYFSASEASYVKKQLPKLRF